MLCCAELYQSVSRGTEIERVLECVVHIVEKSYVKENEINVLWVPCYRGQQRGY